MRLHPLLKVSSAFAVASLLAGAEGGCGGAINSKTPAPDMTGAWAITYDDSLDVEIKLGGSVYSETLPSNGGSFLINHEGNSFEFDLDCSRPEVVCPSEAWPQTVTAEHRNANFPHRFFIDIPKQSCSEALTPADSAECGVDTLNPDCEDVCLGDVVTTTQAAFGVVDEAGGKFDLLLGAGAASNGVNCILLGLSAATAKLETSGSAESEDWTATEMKDGEVAVGYAGGCLWAGDPNMTGQLEAIVLGASVKFTTGFSGARN